MTTALLVAATLLVGIVVVACLRARQRRDELHQLARVLPDCLALLRALGRDPLTPRHARLVVGATLVYLASPVDLIPDFVPVVGYLDDVLVVAWALHHLLVAAGRDRVHELWRGNPATLALLLRLARVP